MKIFNFLTDHLSEVDENYLTHAYTASKIALKFAIAAPMQLLHAFFPFIRPPLGSDVISMRTFLRKTSSKARKRVSKSCCDGQQCQNNAS
jgi:hypothetical protein